MHTRCLLSTALALCLGGSALGESPYFLGLGQLPSGSNSFAAAVSADGSAVAGFGFSPSGKQAMRWTAATGMVGLGNFPFGSAFSEAHAISADGAVLGGIGDRSGGYFEGFRWTQATGLVGVGHLNPDAFSSSVNGVSGDSSVLVGYSQNIGSDGKQSWTEAFRWTQGTGMIGLGSLDPANTFSVANAVSSHGSVIVGRSSTPGGASEAFRWTQATGMVGLGDLAGGEFFSIANAISSNGIFVAGQGSPVGWTDFEAFLWTQNGGMIGLGDLPGGSQGSAAYAVSDSGVAVGVSTASAGLLAFIWDSAHGMRDLRDVLINDYHLNLYGWTLVEARSITPDGLTIVGSGFNPLGQQEAWLVHIPEPGTLALLLVGAPLLRRSRS